MASSDAQDKREEAAVIMRGLTTELRGTYRDATGYASDGRGNTAEAVDLFYLEAIERYFTRDS